MTPMTEPDYRAALKQLVDAVENGGTYDPLRLAMDHARKTLLAEEVDELADKLRGDAECVKSRRDLMLLTGKEMLRIAELLEILLACHHQQ